jgi:organic radical activating enzyme
MRYGQNMCPPPAESSAAIVERILGVVDARINGSRSFEDALWALDDSKRELRRCFGDYLGSDISAQALTLKVLNLRLTKYEFLNRASRLLCKPFGLLVDPCNGCNLACPGCVHSARARSLNLFQWKSGMLPCDRLDAFFGRYGPRGIQTLFCNYGEPLLNADTPRFIRQAKRYLVRTSISTNMSVPRFDADAYVTSGLDYVILSIDGATQENYARYRQNGDLRLVYRNIRALVKSKAIMRRNTPVICWQYLAFTHNVHEAPQPQPHSIWNSLAGVVAVEIFKSPKTAVSRIWGCIQRLAEAAKPTAKTAKPKADRKAKGRAQAARARPRRPRRPRPPAAPRMRPKPKRAPKRRKLPGRAARPPRWSRCSSRRTARRWPRSWRRWMAAAHGAGLHGRRDEGGRIRRRVFQIGKGRAHISDHAVASFCPSFSPARLRPWRAFLLLSPIPAQPCRPSVALAGHAKPTPSEGTWAAFGATVAKQVRRTQQAPRGRIRWRSL